MTMYDGGHSQTSNNATEPIDVAFGRYKAACQGALGKIDTVLHSMDQRLAEPCEVTLTTRRAPSLELVVHLPRHEVGKLLIESLEAADLRRCDRCGEWYEKEMMRWAGRCTTCVGPDESEDA